MLDFVLFDVAVGVEQDYANNKECDCEGRVQDYCAEVCRFRVPLVLE